MTPTGGGFSFSQSSVGGAWRWTVSASNLYGPGQTYQIQDIATPYGPITSVAVPLPADVVEAMAQSIADVRDQVKPRMSLVSTTTSFSVGITEGDPRRGVGSVQVRNDGGFGSYLSLNATSDVPWLSVLTPSTAGIGRGEIASFSFDLVPDAMLASQSPYIGHVTVRDVNDASTAVTLTVSVVVLPRPAIQVNAQELRMSWSISAQIPESVALVVGNAGPGTSSLSFSASKLTGVGWLSASPTSGGPLSPGSTETLSLSTVSTAVPYALGEYTEVVRISSPNASNSPVDVTVILTVGP